MEEKYTQKAIDQALHDYISYKDSIPALSSIKSKFLNPNATTSFFIYKKYNLYDYKFLPSHFYIIVDGKVYHPGNPSEPILVDYEEKKATVFKVEEKCKYCTYHTMNDLFQRDKKFNIFTNNCQIILGNYLSTSLLWIGTTFLLLYVIIGYLSFFYIGSSIMLLSMLYDKMHVRDESFCPHIFNSIIKT